MVDIEKMVKEVQKKRKYENISSEEIMKYASKLVKDLNIDNDEKLKREILISLDKIDNTLWEVKNSDEYMLNDKLSKYVKKLIQKEDYISLTIPIEDLNELAENNIDAKEYFQYLEIFKQRNLPQENVISLIKLPKEEKNKIISNIDEPTFDKIVRNNYCNLYADVDKNKNISDKDKENFLKIVNINNSRIYSSPYNDDFEKDNFHIENVTDLKNAEKMRDTKIEELMDSKYSVYDIKREFCNRFMNIDPIILENCFYNPKNKKILDKMEDIDVLKKIINIGVVDKGDMIRLYSNYMYSGKSINLPEELLTYGYAHTTTKEVNEIKESTIDYSLDKYYHEIYFCRECLLDSNQKKLDRETQFEIPIGALRNNKHFTYENVVRDNVYERNMAYPKIELRKEEIKPEWYIRDYLTLEAISSNVDLNNPKRFENELPMSKNYSHLYDSYMYKEAYDKNQKELRDNQIEKEMNEIFGTVGLTTDEVRNAMTNKIINEDDPII